MSEDQSPIFKQVKPIFTNSEQIPTHYVNAINIRPGIEEFFLTLGTITPPDIMPGQSLEDLNFVNANPLFKCAMTRSVMKQAIDAMTAIYDTQTKQLEQLQDLQDLQVRNEKHGDSDK
jgi:hypothetical protein